MFRFTIRDVLWLTVVVAMALGWLVQVRAVRTDLLERLDREETMLMREKVSLKQHIAELEKVHAEPNP